MARNELDFYPTPMVGRETLIRVAKGRALPDRPLRILEPSAGDGTLARTILVEWPNADLVAIDISPCGPGVAAVSLEDFVRTNPEPFDLILGNPPFELAYAHSVLCHELLKPEGRSCLILPIGFLAGQRRAPWMRANPPAEMAIFSKRLSYTNNGKTDMRDTAVFAWDRDRDREKGVVMQWIS